MLALARWPWFLSIALFFACGADKERAASIGQSGGASSGGSISGKGGASAGAQSGGAHSGGSSSTAGEGSAGESSGGDGGAAGGPLDSPPTATVCLHKASWGPGTRLPLSTAGDDVLGGLTPDELSIVWMSEGKAHYADRNSSAEDFSQAELVPESEGYFAQVTLSPNGLALVGVRLDGAGFGLLTRTARGERFEGTPDESPFEALYGAPAANYSNGPFADPVFSADGVHLLYSALELESNGSVTLYDAREAGGIWPWGMPLPGALLYSENGAFRRPTAISADRRTLFYWDELVSEARVTWRSRLDQAFSGWESLGARHHVTPNGACDRLYYAAPGSGGEDLFVSKRN